MSAADTAWAPLARASREALAQLGRATPRCLPDEADACGGTFAEHVAAHMATLRVLIDHHLEHLGAPESMLREIYVHEAAEVFRHCRDESLPS